MTTPLSLRIAAERTPLIEKAAELLARTVRERSGCEVTRTDAAPAAVELALDAGIGTEGFRIEDGRGGVRIAGGDERGILYGVGKFLRTSRFADGDFTPGAWRGTSVPQTPVRGIYFATHFHNWYHDAPVDEVERYVEELALWGCNALSVWFDMHHYRGIDEPEAQAMIERLKAILRAGNAVGIGASLTMLANEGYAESPARLRAVPTGWAHYGVELDPAIPEGRDLILKWRSEVLDAFADVDVRYVWVWPYDQGGCWCEKCMPWGCGGFLKIGRDVAELSRRRFPQAEVILSTWLFDWGEDLGEYAGLAASYERGEGWADYLMIDSHGDFPRYPLEHGPAGGLPVVGFPEISMFGMGPWGGWGMNPAPGRFQKIWDEAGPMLSGGFPYSEGIFEDVNKAICLGFYWDKQRRALETVREYAAYEYGPDAADDVVRAVQMLEASHGHLYKPDAAEGEPVYEMPNVKDADVCLALIEDVESRMTPAAAAAWRWRTLLLRAELDDELTRSSGMPTEKSRACFEELARIYHADADVSLGLKPPAR